MSGFDPEWLDLRAAADDAARDQKLLHGAAAYASAAKAPLIVDLGAGAGATVRVMTPVLPGGTRWRLVDSDASLLALAQRRYAAVGIETQVRDLSEPEALPVEGARLVTASALFDLVSYEWAASLVADIVQTGAALYAALTYDGRTEWSPAHPLDAPVLAAFNRHQRTNKGFGPALGPDAVPCLRDALERSRFSVAIADSAWRLGPRDAALTERLVAGIAGAAIEDGNLGSGELDGWRRFRLEQAATGKCLIGHLDLFASPPTRPPARESNPDPGRSRR